MLTRKLREIKARRDGGEGGFTLIELLVVIIIIGILASIAIPIFMNQQKTARDAGTTSDVKNAATNVQTGLVKFPDATYFEVTDAAPVAAGTAPTAWTPAASTDGKLTVYVGASDTNWEAFEVTVSNGTVLDVTAGATGGTFTVSGYNANGKSYVAATPLVYNSADGGLS